MKLHLFLNKTKSLFIFLISLLFLFGVKNSPGQGIETFDSLNIPGNSYLDSNFTGNNNIQWFFISARSESSYPINGKGIILRGNTYGSKLYSDSIQGGIGNFSVKIKKAYTSSTNRQISLYINGDSIGSSISFGTNSDTNTYTFSLNNINYTGNFILEIRCIGSGQITLDDIQWTEYSGSQTFNAPTVHTGNVEWITSTSYKIDGNISDCGSSTIVEKGILWGISNDLNFNTSTKSTSTDTNSNFSVSISNLQLNTTYYYCAYAINTTDTGFGETLSFISQDTAEVNDMIETFDLLTSTSSLYTNGSFIGNNNIHWTYTNARLDDPYPINGRGITFRYSANDLAYNSRIVSDSIDGGIKDFSVKLRKAYSGNGHRQVVLYINNDSIASSPRFGHFNGASDTIYNFSVENINQKGKFILEIRHATGDSSNRQLTIDDLTWSKYISKLEINTLEFLSGMIGGEIIDTGLSAIIEKGMLWDINPNLNIETSTKVINTTSDNPFYLSIANIEEDTIYYQAYAINATDTSYGNILRVIPNTSVEIPKYSISQIKGTDPDGVADSLGVLCYIEGIIQTRNMQDNELLFSLYDDTDWLMIYNPTKINGFIPHSRDKVRCIGTVEQHYGVVRFNLESILIISSGNTVQESTEISSLGETTESKLVVIKNLELAENETLPARNDIPASGKVIKCKSATGDIINVRLLQDSNILNNEYSLQSRFDIIGIGSQYDSINPLDSNHEIIPLEIKTSAVINIFPDRKMTDIIIHPNPSNGDFLIKTTEQRNLSMKIYSLTGQLIKESPISKTNEFKFYLPQKGLYFLRIEDINTKESFVQKLIVQ